MGLVGGVAACVSFAESGCNAKSEAIAVQLAREGYAEVKPVTIRSWKSRHKWSRPCAHVIVAPDDAAVKSFEDVAVALLRLACAAANSLSEFIGRFQPTTIAEAEALSRITVVVVTTAAELDDGVLTRLRIDSERRPANGNAVADPSAKSHVDSVVAMFRNAGKKQPNGCQVRPHARLPGGASTSSRRSPTRRKRG